MTVAELIAKLQTANPQAQVHTFNFAGEFNEARSVESVNVGEKFVELELGPIRSSER